MNKKFLLFVIGIILTLIRAAIIFEGRIFAERTTGIAIVISIIGIGLIGASSYRFLK